MIGTGGGFITIEPRRRIIESPLKHPNLFDHKSFVIKTERAKADGVDGDANPAFNLNMSPKELSKDPKNTSLDQPFTAFVSPEPQQPIDQSPSSHAANAPLPEKLSSDGVFETSSEIPVANQAPETPMVLKDEPEEKIVVEKEPEVEEAQVESVTGGDLTKQGVSEAVMLRYQLFEGPPADVYSDPADKSEIRKESNGADGDGGEDKLDSSG
jgi:hypothetical protein